MRSTLAIAILVIGVFGFNFLQASQASLELITTIETNKAKETKSGNFQQDFLAANATSVKW